MHAFVAPSCYHGPGHALRTSHRSSHMHQHAILGLAGVPSQREEGVCKAGGGAAGVRAHCHAGKSGSWGDHRSVVGQTLLLRPLAPSIRLYQPLTIVLNFLLSAFTPCLPTQVRFIATNQVGKGSRTTILTTTGTGAGEGGRSGCVWSVFKLQTCSHRKASHCKTTLPCQSSGLIICVALRSHVQRP